MGQQQRLQRHGEVLGKQAQEIAPHLARGTRILMVGYYEYNRWNDKLTGAEKERLVFVATDMYIKPGDGKKAKKGA